MAWSRSFHFEQVEPRLLLAAHVSAEAAVRGDLATTNAELFLPGSIAGSVYAVRYVGDLVRTADAGIGGVKLQLLDAGGKPLAETLTSATGDYEFPALTPGFYAIREIQPQGFEQAQPVIGSGGGQVAGDDHISHIVVHPGRGLAGYDFLETPIDRPTGLTEAPILQISDPLLAPSVATEVAVFARPRIVAPLLAKPIELAPLVMRPLDPIFGGSSRAVPTDVAVDPDAAFRVGDDEPVDADSGQTADPDRLAADDQAIAAHDRAFELQADEPENDRAPTDVAGEPPESAADPRRAAAPRLVSNPAA